MTWKTGLTSKDFIAPTSFCFRDKRTFRVGETCGAASFIQIFAPELTDRMLADLLDMEIPITVNLHIQSIDQSDVIKRIKHKLSDLEKMRIEEQKKAVRAGYDMDVLPPDLVTYGKEAHSLLEDYSPATSACFSLRFLWPIRQKRSRLSKTAFFRLRGLRRNTTAL